jgi:hypothetical protein
VVIPRQYDLVDAQFHGAIAILSIAIVQSLSSAFFQPHEANQCGNGRPYPVNLRPEIEAVS